VVTSGRRPKLNGYVGSTELEEVADAASCTMGATHEYFVNEHGRLELCPDTCPAVGLQAVVAKTTACAE